MNKILYQKPNSEELMSIGLGKAAQELRGKLGLSLRQAAAELGVSHVHLCHVENGKASPSPEMLEKFHEAWGIDLYVYALAFFSNDRKVPKNLRSPVRTMAAAWKEHIQMLLNERSKEGAGSCLTSVD